MSLLFFAYRRIYRLSHSILVYSYRYNLTSNWRTRFLYGVFSSQTLAVNTAAFIVAFFLFCAILFSTGMSDFLFEKNFSSFQWPSHVDVKNQVVRELLGEPAEYLYLNDWNGFMPLVKPSCHNNKLTRKRSILIIVKSSPNRLSQRQAIRTTWGSVQQESGFRIRTIFVMGTESPTQPNQSIFEESKEFEDLLIGNFVDHYRNNTLKFIYSMGLAKEFCSAEQAIPYLLLIDDDYMLSPRNLALEAQKHAPNERLYMGWRFLSSPFRLFFQKHRVSLSDYPYAAFPPYISAGAVFLSGQTVKEFYLAIQHLKVFMFDDVYAGIMAYFLGISAQHNENFSFYRTSHASLEDELRQWKTAIAIHGYKPSELLDKYAEMEKSLGV